ncbi:MAG: GGDEF domain-containing protein [Solibacillus sp.]
MTELIQLLKENNYIKGFEIHYVEQEYEHYVRIDASQVYIGEEVFYYCMIHDVTFEYQQAKISEYLAYHDPLTGIHNRAYFERTVKDALAKLSPTKEAVLILSDLNFFKAINDTHGHQIGDEVLTFTAQSFSNYLPRPHVLARLGGR